MTEMEERNRLEQVRQKLLLAVKHIDTTLRDHAVKIREQKTYLWEHRADMDHVEKITTRQLVEQRSMLGEHDLARKNRLLKLLLAPYFGRFDFTREGETQPLPVYVGIHTFFDEKSNKYLIYDWRAPIATMFYDYETGAARYHSPSGEIAGRISLKRQFRIRDGRLEFMLESTVNILDDVLQEELSRSADDRMKNIVATIQRDQNAIIRNEDAHELIIQGVAGSGKTSIALHRIAFLLYRFKETLTSQEILIISPNQVFADYISNVLPELGEENIAETRMETLADELLEGKFKFQTFFQQAARLLEKRDEALQRRIQEKASLAFLKKLDSYAAHLEKNSIRATDLQVSRHPVPARFIEASFRKHRAMPAASRVRRVAGDIEHRLAIDHNYELTAGEKKELRSALGKMERNQTLRAAYKNFFAWLDQPDLFKPVKGAELEYCDVFPLIYLKIRLEGLKQVRHDVKHLLIDEMQDYTPVQYAVLARLFPCRKTILGDVGQSVNPFSSSSAEQIGQVFRRADCVKLCKSYRSTFEITRFAQRIAPNPDLVAIERHGEEPAVLGLANKKAETAHIRRLIADFAGSGHRTLGIICKTQGQAEELQHAIDGEKTGVHLLTAQSTGFAKGVVICTVHLAKGLEFDQVIVPGATEANYACEIDRNLLYIACTRAMHRLTLTFAGRPTRFVH
ncbi:HelD family protein [Desulfurivibrio sp. D14AmB]|uniref:HelD family protein n=1 Tax=Desulfurivibrio sp. D14AmB TaxID=3374370 RepID=UPI00376EFE70